MPQIFPIERGGENKVICFTAIGSNKRFHVLVADQVVDLHFTGDTQCLPLYRYTEEGERISNITGWGLRRFREHYGDDGITEEDIFAYTYAVLHHPAYLHEYRVDLLREFPRLPFYADFGEWARMGSQLIDLHVGFESAEPYPLERVDTAKEPTRVMLRANRQDKERGVIHLDDGTTAEGRPRVGVALPAGQPVRAGVGAGPVQGAQAPGSRP